MNEKAKPEDYKDRSRILALIGVLLLLVGIGGAMLGPPELYCFYFFVEGGRFHYEGFGFGSFMFAFIAVQIVAYYVIALVCIPLGYGHVKQRRWARTLTLAGMGFWSILGLPLVVVFFATLVLSKDPSLGTLIAMLPVMVFLYPVLPGLLTWLYRSKDVRLTFETNDPRSYWTEKLPLPMLTLCMLFAFFIVALHVAILFRGAFPLFGVLLSELSGVVLIDASVVLLAVLTWGTLRRKPWAWWVALAYFSLMTASTVWTFAGLSWADILDMMKFAPLEMEALSGVPIQGTHIAAFVGLPLLATLGLLIYSKRYFAANDEFVCAEKQAKVMT